MKIEFKKLSMNSIEQSSEIQFWLDQFQKEKRSTAIDLLLKLQFVTRDMYAEWLKSTLLKFESPSCALYAVRKYDNSIQSIWDANGESILRPSTSLGSEDFVQSIVASVMKSHDKRFYDTPSLTDLKEHKIRDLLLLDDSIGSGQRVSSFINMMMVNKNFRSWWSLGWIRLYITSFSRNRESARRIFNSIPGSNHHIRKFPKSTKVEFIGHLVYDGYKLSERWGKRFQDICDLCQSERAIPMTYRLGFNETMANIIFYHSVPDTIPGILWYNENRKWTPLFAGRTVPSWLPEILDVGTRKEATHKKISASLITVLRLAKRGIRKENSMAQLIGLDIQALKEIASNGRTLGLLTKSNCLTEAGMRVLRAEKKDSVRQFNRSMYIPKSSCVGWGTVQPSDSNRLVRTVQTDSVDGLPFVDGEAGQASLEKTDARTAAPSVSVMPHQPSKPRAGHDTHGPKG